MTAHIRWYGLDDFFEAAKLLPFSFFRRLAALVFRYPILKLLLFFLYAIVICFSVKIDEQQDTEPLCQSIILDSWCFVPYIFGTIQNATAVLGLPSQAHKTLGRSRVLGNGISRVPSSALSLMTSFPNVTVCCSLS